LKYRAIGFLLLLALALAVLPAVAMAAPAITQGVQGVITDGTTGLPVPFAEARLLDGLGDEVGWTRASYDGTYAIESEVGTHHLEVWAFGYETETSPDFNVDADAVTTQNISLTRWNNYYMPVYRFFNMTGGVHFYTSDPVEFMNVYKNLPDYKYDGIGYSIPVGADIAPEGENAGLMNTNKVVLQRFYNMQTGVHFYTADVNEFNNVRNTLSSIYHYDGPAYKVTFDSDYGSPIYRFYNGTTNAHFYTANTNEIYASLAGTYKYEGVAFYTGGWVDSYALNYSAGEGGTVTGNSAQVVAEGQEGTPVTAVADAGYVFVQWDDGNTDPTRTDWGDGGMGNQSFEAQFAAD